jgi:hypothetical protein
MSLYRQQSCRRLMYLCRNQMKTFRRRIGVKFLPEATATSPFRLLAPLPVLKVPVPDCVNVLFAAMVVSPFIETAPEPVLNDPVPFCVKVLFVAICVSPFSETEPDPVENAPVPDWVKFLPELTVTSPLRVIPPLDPARIVTELAAAPLDPIVIVCAVEVPPSPI